MKINRVFTGAVLPLLLAAIYACSRSVFEKIPEGQIDPVRKQTAERVARRLFSSWKMGIYNSLGEEFSAEMRRAFTPRVQRQTYQDLKMRFGELEDLTFAEAVRPRNTPDMVIYRFRAKFSGTDEQPEIRVVMDRDGKISGFWCKPWHRRLQ